MRPGLCLIILLTNLTPGTFGQANEGKSSEEITCPIERIATFPGGSDSLQIFIAKTLIKPTNTEKKGRVYISFVVNVDGTLNDFKIVRGLTEDCDVSALTVVKKMPNWIPGTMNKIPVRQQIVLPIKFE